MVLPTITREHVLTGLSATPRVLGLLSGPLSPNSPVWELSLPGRFTLRQTMAHLADWDHVFRARANSALKGTALQTEPDSAKLAKERNYDDVDPHDALNKFATARYELLRLFRGLTPEDWAKSVDHPKHGPMSLEIQAVHVLGHDGYHLDAISSMMALAGIAEAGMAEPAMDRLGLEN